MRRPPFVEVINKSFSFDFCSNKFFYIHYLL